MVYITSGVDWFDAIAMGTLFLVLGITFVTSPASSPNPLLTPAFIAIGTVLIADGLWDGKSNSWKWVKNR